MGRVSAARSEGLQVVLACVTNTPMTTRTPLEQFEHILERGLFASRWLLAPLYVGMVVILVMIVLKFFKKLWLFAIDTLTMSDSELILGILSLIDLSLAANLVVIVILSGYENFVSKIDSNGHKDWPEWMGKVDFSGLKLKLVASIVALSAVHLLKAFMDVHKYSDRELIWLSGIHALFVGTGLFLALTDKITASSKIKPVAKTKD